MVLAVVVYHLVHEYTPAAIGDWVAHAFPVDSNHLRGSLVKLVGGGYSGLVCAVRGVRVPIIPRGVLGYYLLRCLLILEEMLG